MGFLCLNKGAETPPEQVVAECVKLVRDQIGPVAAFKLAVRGGPSAQDALGQDPARDHGQDRRWRELQDARDHRRSGDPRRDRPQAGGSGRLHPARPGRNLAP
jgi:hypothetical protein